MSSYSECEHIGRRLISPDKPSDNYNLNGNIMLENLTEVTNNYTIRSSSTKRRKKLDFIRPIFASRYQPSFQKQGEALCLVKGYYSCLLDLFPSFWGMSYVDSIGKTEIKFEDEK